MNTMTPRVHTGEAAWTLEQKAYHIQTAWHQAPTLTVSRQCLRSKNGRCRQVQEPSTSHGEPDIYMEHAAFLQNKLATGQYLTYNKHMGNGHLLMAAACPTATVVTMQCTPEFHNPGIS